MEDVGVGTGASQRISDIRYAVKVDNSKKIANREYIVEWICGSDTSWGHLVGTIWRREQGSSNWEQDLKGIVLQVRGQRDNGGWGGRRNDQRWTGQHGEAQSGNNF